MKNYGAELGWEIDVDFPSWANTEIYVKTISKGYLLEGEKPKDAYWRVATTAARRLGKPQMATKFFDYIWKGWLNLATPVLSNTGTDRGLPISCFGIDVADSIQDIGTKNLEMMLLAKHGGGVGVGLNMIRPAGSNITQNGTSDGVVPFAKIYDSTILATNQGSVRRGRFSPYLPIDHPDIKESAVVGVKDDDLGEVPVAVIVVDMEFKNQVLTDLENVFQRNLAKFKVPREIRILDELPRNAMGKIQKNLILNLIA